MIKDITETWVTDRKFLLLKVPSALVEGDYNYLINSMHPWAVELVITNKQPYRFDLRLLH